MQYQDITDKYVYKKRYQIKKQKYFIDNDGTKYNVDGKYVIEGNLKKKKKQANNFIIDLTNTKIEFKEVERQIESIYISRRYLWIDKIVIIKGNNIEKVYKRNKWRSTANQKMGFSTDLPIINY